MQIEFKILDWIQNMRTPIGDVIMPVISRIGDAGLVWMLLAAGLLLMPKKRKSGMILAAALCLDIILCNGILKNVFCRIRPCDINTSVSLLVARPDDFSFPSGHTAASFAAVAALYFAGEKNLWKPSLILAVCIALSRLYLYVHYPTDILGGMIVGIVVGAISCWTVKKLEQWRIRRKKKGDGKHGSSHYPGFSAG